MHIGDENNEELDFGAVQRGDPEMEQKLNRVIRAAIENTGTAMNEDVLTGSMSVTIERHASV